MVKRDKRTNNDESFVNLLTGYKEKEFDISSIIHTSVSNNVMSITIGRRFDYDDPTFKYFVHLLITDNTMVKRDKRTNNDL
jgi:hypothetical protein